MKNLNIQLLRLAICALVCALPCGSMLIGQTVPGTEKSKQSQPTADNGSGVKSPKTGQPPVEERLSILEEELERLKVKGAVKHYKSEGGMGPAASEVYHAGEGFSFGGYAETIYRDNRSPYLRDQFDMTRFILYTGYKFSDRIVFNSELEYEHAGFKRETVVTDVDFVGRKTKKGNIASSEVFVEFAYLDFKFADQIQLAAGLNLVPIGITNYMHEPTTFNSADRPYSETIIIPSVWRELGFLLHGDLFDKKFVYRTGLMTAGSVDEFSSSSWIRGSRSKGSQAPAETFAYVINGDFKGIEGLVLGGTYYTGNYGQRAVTPADWKVRTPLPDAGSLTDNSELIKAYNEREANKPKNAPINVHIAEAHFDWKHRAFETRGLFVRGWMNENDARSVNRTTGKNVGMEVEGAYLEFSYNVLSLIETKYKLNVFVRGEYVNTQKRTAERHFGGKEDAVDYVCANMLAGSCKTTAKLPNGNRDLGIISASDAGRELYGVQGTPDRTNDRRIRTIGLAFFPDPKIVFKLDYEQNKSKSNYHRDIEYRNPKNNNVDQIRFAIGLIF